MEQTNLNTGFIAMTTGCAITNCASHHQTPVPKGVAPLTPQGIRGARPETPGLNHLRSFWYLLHTTPGILHWHFQVLSWLNCRIPTLTTFYVAGYVGN